MAKEVRARVGAQEEPGDSSEGDAGGRSRRERRSVVRFSPNGGTVDMTITRAHTTPRTLEERECELLTKRAARVQIAVGAQVGTRLVEMMTEATTPGGRSDRRGDG